MEAADTNMIAGVVAVVGRPSIAGGSAVDVVRTPPDLS